MLLIFKHCVTDFAFWSSFSTSLLMRSAFSSSFISRAPPAMMIAPIELVLAASSIISPMSLKMAPDFTRVLMGLPLALSPRCSSRRRLSPTSSVVGFNFASLMLVTTLGSWLAFATTSRNLRISSHCCSAIVTSCWLELVNFLTSDSRADVFSSKRDTSTGNC